LLLSLPSLISENPLAAQIGGSFYLIENLPCIGIAWGVQGGKMPLQYFLN
jgi:hypothetical protein